MQKRELTLRLQAPLHIRLLSWFMALLGYLSILLFLQDRTLFFSLIIWTAIHLRGVFYAPELTVYANGIETHRFGIRHFTHWRDIQAIHIGEYVSQIYPKNIHPATRYLLYSYLMVMFWRSNYKEAMQIVKNNVRQAQELLPQRVYE